MVRVTLLTLLTSMFFFAGSLVAAGGLNEPRVSRADLSNLTRRNCGEILGPDGQQLIDDDGTPQFNCDFYMPTMQQIADRIASTGLVNDPNRIPAYYTGWSSNEIEGELGGWINEWIKAYLARQPSPQPRSSGYYWWCSAVPQHWWYAQREWIINHQGDGGQNPFPQGSALVFDACISEVLASLNVGKESEHTSFLLSSSQTTNRVETDDLPPDPLVETIYRVDPRPPILGRISVERVIWRSFFKPQPQLWKCTANARPLLPPPAVLPIQNNPTADSVRIANITTHFNNLSRRECWAEEDLSGAWEYDAKQCDNYMPTLSQCQAHLQQSGLINDPGNIAVYYTGWKNPLSMADITQWTTAYMAKYISSREGTGPKGWYWYWTALDMPWYNVQEQYIMDNSASMKNLDSDIITNLEAKEALIVCMCEAFAVSCVSPIVLLMVPNDYVLGEENGRHWWTIEYGSLTKNTNVQKIYRVDPRPLEDSKKECEDPGKLKPKLIWKRGRDPQPGHEFQLSCKMFVTDPPPPTAAPPVEPRAQNPPRSGLEVSTNTHLYGLSRRECRSTNDAMTGQQQYLPENCDDYMPTLAQCQNHLKRIGPGGSPAISDSKMIPIYYTGWPEGAPVNNLFQWTDAFIAKYLAVEQKPDNPKWEGWYWFWNVIDQDWYDVQEKYLIDNAGQLKNIKPIGKDVDPDYILDNCMVEAYSASCVADTVFLMVPQDYTPGSKGQEHRHWFSIEFGALTRNPNVQEIFRLDPSPHDTDDHCIGYAPMLIWKRGVDDEAAQAFFCENYVGDGPTPPPDQRSGTNPLAPLLKRLDKPWANRLANKAYGGSVAKRNANSLLFATESLHTSPKPDE